MLRVAMYKHVSMNCVAIPCYDQKKNWEQVIDPVHVHYELSKQLWDRILARQQYMADLGRVTALPLILQKGAYAEPGVIATIVEVLRMASCPGLEIRVVGGEEKNPLTSHYTVLLQADDYPSPHLAEPIGRVFSQDPAAPEEQKT
jgi:hypothetical protein